MRFVPRKRFRWYKISVLYGVVVGRRRLSDVDCVSVCIGGNEINGVKNRLYLHHFVCIGVRGARARFPGGATDDNTMSGHRPSLA